MRINEYKSLDEFTSQYVGEWGPSDGHWYGLDFSYHGIEYRLHTGSMYKKGNTILPDGREALFGLYKKINGSYNADYGGIPPTPYIFLSVYIEFVFSKCYNVPIQIINVLN